MNNVIKFLCLNALLIGSASLAMDPGYAYPGIQTRSFDSDSGQATSTDGQSKAFTTEHLSKYTPGAVTDKGQELQDAAKAGNLELVQALLTAGAPVDAKRSWSLMTPLMWAARGGRMDLCQLLIAANAQVDAKFSGGWTVLNIAAAYNHEPICHLLINRTLDQSILPGAMITLLGIKKFHKSPLLGQIDRHIINNIIRQACAHAPKIKALFTQIEAIENKDMKNNLRECAQQRLKLKMDQKTNNGDSHE